MSKRSELDFLRDIQEAIRRIMLYIAEDNYQSFMANTMAQDAVIRNLEIIGEATKNLSADLRDEYATIP